MATPIFEETVSALYYSNDARLHLITAHGHEGGTQYVLELDEVEVFRTRDRVKADAYIAGYDLAEEQARKHARNEAALTKAFGAPGTVTKVNIEGLYDLDSDEDVQRLIDDAGRES